MNLLGTYVLGSLLFVFAAMTEFALVLFVKQKQACKNPPRNCEPNGDITDEIPKRKVHEICNALVIVDQEKTEAGSVQDTDGIETRNVGFWARKCTAFYGLPLTTKIDFAGLVIFYFSYLICNFVYLIHVLNLVY